MYGTFGAENFTFAISARKDSSIGSIIAEWNACEVCNILQGTPRSFNSFANSSTAGVGPATAHCSGPFTTATDNPLGNDRLLALTATESIEPRGISSISRPRTAL